MRVTIVGASLAGYRTADALRRRGFDGSIVLIGEESRAPYDRPPLSKGLLRGDISPEDVMLPSRTPLALDERLGVRATALDVEGRTVHLETGEEVPYDVVIAATGSRARRLPSGHELDGVHTLRTLEDALAIRRDLSDCSRLVVVGAGFIGSEVASTSLEIGKPVTVVSLESTPLERAVGTRLGGVLGRRQIQAGVDLRCGVTVTGFVGEGRVEAVVTDDGELPADLVVVGVGAVPNDEWLESSGLEVDDGLVCDDHCRALGTNDVYAVGDVARWFHAGYREFIRLEHWTNACDQAEAVASAITGDPQPFRPVPYVWSDQFGSRIQVFGRITPGCEIEFIVGSPEADSWVAVAGRDGSLEGAVGWNAARELRGVRAVLLRNGSWEEALALSV